MAEFDYDVNDSVYEISAYLSHPDRTNGFWLGFPTSKEELQSALKTIGAESGEIEVWHYATGEIELHNRLPKTLNAQNLDELNYLAVRLDTLTDPEHEIFAAVVEAGWHCDSLRDIVNIGENIEKFDLWPAYNAEQYGEFHLDLARDEYADIVKRLLNSEDSKDRDFASYVEDIEENLNLAFYGRLQAEREGGVFTKQGYLTKTGEFEEIYRSFHDLPDDFKVYTVPEETAPAHEPIIRVVYTYAGADNTRVSETVDYPASGERIAELLSNAGINGTDERVFFVDSYESKHYGLAQVLNAIEDGVHPSELNDLAKKLDGLGEREERLFTSALEMHRYGGDMEGLFNFASRLTQEAEFVNNPPEKESVLKKIRVAMAQPKQPHKPRTHDKSEPNR